MAALWVLPHSLLLQSCDSHFIVHLTTFFSCSSGVSYFSVGWLSVHAVAVVASGPLFLPVLDLNFLKCKKHARNENHPLFSRSKKFVLTASFAFVIWGMSLAISVILP